MLVNIMCYCIVHQAESGSISMLMLIFAGYEPTLHRLTLSMCAMLHLWDNKNLSVHVRH